MATEQPTNEIDLAQQAARPRSVEGDAGKFEGHSLPDLIEADKHLARKRTRPFSAFKSGLGTLSPGANH
jgi:hypothetical protein